MAPEKIDLRSYHKFGLTLLQWALIIGTLGLTIVAIREYLL